MDCFIRCIIRFYNTSSAVQSYSRVDPAQEIARLRHSISLLESYIFPTHRTPPQQRRQSDASNLVLKKELLDPDVTDKHPVPGILGNQGQGLSQGLYAGPTSAATHLLVPFFIYFPVSSRYLTISLSTKIVNALRKNRIYSFITQITQGISLVSLRNTTVTFSHCFRLSKSSMGSSSSILNIVTGYTGT